MTRLPVFLIAFGLAAAVASLVFTAGNASALDQNQCLSCHGKKDLVKTSTDGRRISLYVNEERVNTASHRYIDCSTCHGPEPHKTNSQLTKKSLAEKCGSCHQYEYALHRTSIHGQQLQAGNSDVATCVDCHSPEGNPHSVIRVLEYSAPAYKKNIAQTCDRCHGQTQLMQNYGIVEEVYESYMRSFHGRAMAGSSELSQLNFATCTNCHGFHDIRSVKDSSSPVAGLDSLATTCEQCHPGAGVNFAMSFLGHKEASPQNVPPVYYTQIGFTIFLSTVIALGVVILIGGIIGIATNRWRH